MSFGLTHGALSASWKDCLYILIGSYRRRMTRDGLENSQFIRVNLILGALVRIQKP